MVRLDLVDVGDTFKHAKAVVKGIEWGSGASGEARKYYLDLDAERFKMLDGQAWNAIESGKAKL
jgi:hypothetical protein